jgi:hypothetical protein
VTERTDQLSPDEMVLRRIPNAEFKPATKEVKFGAFVPTKKDVTGISFQQLSKMSPGEMVDRATGKGPYLVVQFSVGELRDMGLNPVITDSDGHVEIPELSFSERANDPDKIDEILIQLATKASEDGRIALGLTMPRRS